MSAEGETVVERLPGGIETMAAAFVGMLAFGDGDPRRGLGEVVVELARMVDDNRCLVPALRELRIILVQMVEVPDQPAGVVDELRLRRAQRILSGLRTLP